MRRVLVTGSRQWTDYATIGEALRDQYIKYGPFVIVHGACPEGVDAIASEWAKWAKFVNSGCIEEHHPAAWKVDGRSAGPKRNQMMVDLGANVCLAFPTICPGDKHNCPRQQHYSHGTSHCMSAARRSGIPVENFGPGLDE